MEEPNTTEDLLVDLSAGRFSVAFSILFFGFGIAAGFLLAFSGLGFLQDSAGVIAGVFLVALSALALSGVVLWLLRDRILRRLFGIAESQVGVIAGPLADVAQGAARRDPEQAAQSARRLIQVALARYAWLATRRWIMTSLTALIAAMAALAGTALLFKQNDLIAQQIVLLAEQNTGLQQQNALLEEQNVNVAQQSALLVQQTELAEAARNAQLAVEVTAISAALADIVDRTMPRAGGDDAGMEAVIPVLDPRRDLPRSLLFRIIAVSQALRPYRFLDPGLNPHDDYDVLRAAIAPRRPQLEALYQRYAEAFGWQERPGPSDLVDRPASPERGQLLRVLQANGVSLTELLSFFGLDLTFAHAPGLNLNAMSLRMADLAYADFSFGTLVESDLRGATLANLRLRRAQVLRSRFDALPYAQAPEGFATDGNAVYASDLRGIDLSGALVIDCSFQGARMTAALFDGALVQSPDFRGTDLGAASFRDALLVNPRWQGAGLWSVDLDGAILFGADPLAELTAAAEPDSFTADRWRAEPVTLADALEPFNWPQAEVEAVRGQVGDARVWRLVREGEFR
ncbi:MAG: pentapeptide repeat-containing protein [Rhodobacteraceae bacterium]|nr:pentapeptide repeat-containing protein [Paracoccaceae bacterium]